FAPIIELLLHLVLDDGALFLDDEDLLQPLGEMAHAVALERPAHSHLVEPEPDFSRELVVYPEIVQRLTHIEIGFSRGDDAEARGGAVDDDAVEMVEARESKRRIELVF